MKLPTSVAPEGLPYYGGFFLLFLIFLGLKLYSLAFICGGVSLFCLYFFRDPHRVVIAEMNSLIAPADGKVLFIGPEKHHPLFPEGCQKLSIFMSVFDVHFNRSPSAGKILKIHYKKGRFFPANKDFASLENEQNELWLEIDDRKYALNQIAGIIARRIRCYVREGDTLVRGQKIGLIQFGSRVDLYLPTDFRFDIRVNSKVKAGITVIGSFRE